MKAHRTWRQVDGVLLLDKPRELSSNAALQKVRHIFKAEKAGHTGTLDPLATGLLPVCLGEATKFSMGLLDADKTYHATIQLGQNTSTGDLEGEVIQTRSVNVNGLQIQETLNRFRGEILQTPPMYSALKFQGKPLYEYIRQGQVIERPSRAVFIHELQLESFNGQEMEISVRCSKGTYIRTLGEDIGEALGCGGFLTTLRRTSIADFKITKAVTLSQLETMDDSQLFNQLLPVDCMLLHLPVVELNPEEFTRIIQGQRLRRADLSDGKVRLYFTGNFIGAGEVSHATLSPSRLLANSALFAPSIQLT